MVLITIIILILLAETSYLTYRALIAPESRTTGRAPLFVDTSALMDGRIVTAAQTGFLPSPIAIPNSVINELQLLADQADAEKRSRARRGLDAIKELQDVDWLEVKIIKDGPTGSGGVDSRLVELAKKHHGTICTIDFNLNKVASVQGIRVLNINELAGSIRMAFLPGETISLPLTQKGQNATQAVGYLADGTMVVVEKAASSIGKTVEIEFIRSLQTAAGRMMFARLKALSKAEQTRGEAEGRSRVKSKAEKAKTRRSAEEKTSLHTQDSKPAKSQTSRRRTSRRTKEDSLIELVNNQD